MAFASRERRVGTVATAYLVVGRFPFEIGNLLEGQYNGLGIGLGQQFGIGKEPQGGLPAYHLVSLEKCMDVDEMKALCCVVWCCIRLPDLGRVRRGPSNRTGHGYLFCFGSSFKTGLGLGGTSRDTKSTVHGGREVGR